jgi:hypothetical protein
MCPRSDGITEYFTILSKNHITPLKELKEATVNKQQRLFTFRLERETSWRTSHSGKQEQQYSVTSHWLQDSFWEAS